jgi:F-type H+-transporting ATPase subunit c
VSIGIVEIVIMLAALIVTMGIIVPAIGQTRAIIKAMEGIARQPEAAGPIGNNLIIGLAFIESLAIYVLVIALILLFANPYTQDMKTVSAAKAQVEVLELQLRQAELQNKLDQLTPAK